MHAYEKGKKVSPWVHFLSKSPEDTMMELTEATIPPTRAAYAGSSGL